MTEADVQRERDKIARFYNIKERNGRVLAERESRISNRIKDMEKKQTDFEKRKKNERKMDVARHDEKRSEWQTKR